MRQFLRTNRENVLVAQDFLNKVIKNCLENDASIEDAFMDLEQETILLIVNTWYTRFETEIFQNENGEDLEEYLNTEELFNK